jgi:predicted nucleic acid-binding Zn ribbon protein
MRNFFKTLQFGSTMPINHYHCHFLTNATNLLQTVQIVHLFE